MNIKTVVAVALVCGLAALSGCASMGKDKDSRSVTSSVSDEVDVAYMAEINRQAKERWMTVLWVNPPKPKQHGN